MTEIELQPRTLRLLDHIVREGKMRRDRIDSVERIGLLFLLQGALVHIDYGYPNPTVMPTEHGEQLVEETGLDSATTVEAVV